jgi:hypothetical protein
VAAEHERGDHEHHRSDHQLADRAVADHAQRLVAHEGDRIRLGRDHRLLHRLAEEPAVLEVGVVLGQVGGAIVGQRALLLLEIALGDLEALVEHRRYTDEHALPSGHAALRVDQDHDTTARRARRSPPGVE